jgi:SOS-response transcriptional repressor LexA
MNKRALTEKQKNVLEYIDAYQKEYKVIPTFVEIAQKEGVTIAAIQHRLAALIRKKVIVRKNIYEILSADSCAILNGGVNEKTSDESADLTHINN